MRQRALHIHHPVHSPPWEVGPLETKSQRCSHRVTRVAAELGTDPEVNVHQEVNSAQSTKEARQCLSEEWAGTSFSVNDRKCVSGSQLVMALVKFLQIKSIYSESQVSSWGKYSCSCSRRHTGNRQPPTGGWGKWSRQQVPFLLHNKAYWSPSLTSSPWIISLRWRASEKCVRNPSYSGNRKNNLE